MESRQYIIVTPCKNESDNLPNLIQSVVEQTARPVLWMIVDDGSTDDTPEIIKEAEEKYSWVKSIRLDSSKRDLGLHLAHVMKRGFDFGVEYCKKNGIDYSYVGNLDGDLTLELTFYENIMKGFEKDPELGVASGGTKHIIGDYIRYAKVEEDEPSGGHMLIRRACFEECGGFPLAYAMDSVLKAKARLRGWKTKRFEECIATEIRDVNSAEGYWRGFVYKGKTSYYLNHNPLHVMIRTILYLFRRPYYIGIAYIIGYLGDFIKRKGKIEDDEIKKYFWNKWKKVIKKRSDF
jgi:glycosyltransferase involved in cell wall biosynthesis